jgi:carbon-monoxide dehydrogenase small subunit
MEQTIKLKINREIREVQVEPYMTLLEVLRDKLGLTGAKKACEKGDCGACTILLEGMPVDSCLILIMDVKDKEITTIEGLSQDGKIHPLQEAFYRLAATQCGFCTPGMILSSKALLDHNPLPSLEQIKHALSGNLCRCTGYYKPIEAIMEAARKMARNISSPNSDTQGTLKINSDLCEE